MSERSIRIVSVPPGDAPLWVREKWVGLDLPIVGNNSGPALTVSINVKATWLHHLWAILRGRSEKVTGYRVDAARAVDILAASNPEAAEWWRQNASGYLLPGRIFMFHAEACRLNAI